MNKNLPIGLVILLLIGVIFYNALNKSSSSEPVTTIEQTISPQTDYTLTLFEQNNSSESGTATFKEVDGKVQVTLNMTGAPAGIAQPAHIHVGVCPEVGAVKYPLTNAIDGVSVTTLDTTFEQIKSEQPLGLNVHKSVPETKVYVACGDLAL